MMENRIFTCGEIMILYLQAEFHLNISGKFFEDFSNMQRAQKLILGYFVVSNSTTLPDNNSSLGRRIVENRLHPFSENKGKISLFRGSILGEVVRAYLEHAGTSEAVTCVFASME